MTDNVNTYSGAQDSESGVLSSPVATPPAAGVPSGQLPPAGPELFARARDAVTALRGRGRRPNGQAGPGNTLSLRTGLRSTQLLEQPDVAAWHRQQVQAISGDLGGESELSALSRASVREAARLEVILGALGDELLEHGPLTGKGKCRSATTVYLQVLDRFVKIAGTLGLARQARRLTGADAVAAYAREKYGPPAFAREAPPIESAANEGVNK